MNWKTFTPEQVVTLRANPYVKSVTDKMVRFTVAFKEQFWKEYQEGRTASIILSDMGFDVKMLGQKRIEGIYQRLRRQAEKGEEFREERRASTTRGKSRIPASDLLPTAAGTAAKAPANMLDYLLHRVAYLEQELDFLKKTISIGNGKKSPR